MISGHGGRWTNSATFTLPANITVHFFVADGSALSNERSATPNGWTIFDNWQNHAMNLVRQDVLETAQPGDVIYDYECWEMDENQQFLDASGIFDATGRIELLNDEANSETLSSIIGRMTTTYPGQQLEIFWVCCRTIS